MLKRIGYTAGGFVLIGVLAVAILWGLSVGTVQFSLSQIFNIVMDQFSSPLAIDDPMNGSRADHYMVIAYAAAVDGCHYRGRSCRIWRYHAGHR